MAFQTNKDIRGPENAPDIARYGRHHIEKVITVVAKQGQLVPLRSLRHICSVSKSSVTGSSRLFGQSILVHPKHFINNTQNTKTLRAYLIKRKTLRFPVSGQRFGSRSIKILKGGGLAEIIKGISVVNKYEARKRQSEE